MDLFVPFAKAPLSNTRGIPAILMPLGETGFVSNEDNSGDRIAHPQKWV